MLYIGIDTTLDKRRDNDGMASRPLSIFCCVQMVHGIDDVYILFDVNVRCLTKWLSRVHVTLRGDQMQASKRE